MQVKCLLKNTMFKYKYFQPKKSDSIKSKQDCMIRCICAVVIDWDYNEIYKQMFNCGYRASATNKDSWDNIIKNTLDKFGFDIKRHSFPAVKGEKRMTAKTFAERFVKGVFVLQMAGHVATMRDGVLLDTFDCSEKCVYTAFEVKER